MEIIITVTRIEPKKVAAKNNNFDLKTTFNLSIKIFTAIGPDQNKEINRITQNIVSIFIDFKLFISRFEKYGVLPIECQSLKGLKDILWKICSLTLNKIESMKLAMIITQIFPVNFRLLNKTISEAYKRYNKIQIP